MQSSRTPPHPKTQCNAKGGYESIQVHHKGCGRIYDL